MKSSSASFFQAVITLIGIGVLALMLWEPHLEGRNAHATTFEVYFKDPFLAYVYVGSIPFFVALYRAFGLFGHARQTGSFSQVTVDALHAIKRCAIILIGFVMGAVVIILMMGEGEDRAGGVFMSLLFTVGAGTVAIVAARFARRVQDSLRLSVGGRG